ncbi:hypothetical protein ANAPC1_01280 [Anaplasma phagocytophilum]|uniref:Uncharacterized protein n=1 Tax=Anaplasma phagocytophilum TaxID=948 RepID=A0AA45UU27_ANAPH|nr:hypothetical protein ANAPC1_01280 [Anaplasma phagocytophilum]
MARIMRPMRKRRRTTAAGAEKTKCRFVELPLGSRVRLGIVQRKRSF